MPREEQVREFVMTRFPRRYVFAKDVPANSGVHFGLVAGDPEPAFVVHPGQVVAMSEALSDDSFTRFLAALMTWATFVIEFVEDGDDIGEAILDGQRQLADRDPESYSYLAFVFDDE